MLHYTGRPNVLVVVTDQQRADAVGYEQPWIKTPNLDGLAAESIVCPRAFVQSPQCQPSRASIFTGRYPTAHKVWWNGIDLPKSERVLGSYFKEAGYSTGYFGKHHFSDGHHTETIRHFGFQESFLYEDWIGLLPGLRNRKGERSAVEQEFYGAMGTKTWTGSFTNKELHHEEMITDRAAAFMTESRKPFLCVVSYHGPHPPYAAPGEFSKLYRRADMPVPMQQVVNPLGHLMTVEDWQELKTQYYGAVSWIDSCLGRLLELVDNTTVVIYTSDHGDILGDHGLFSKGMYAYEGNTRVPLVVRLPFLSPGVYPHLVQSIDLLPTILASCDLQVPPSVQGRDLGGVLATGERLNGQVLSFIGYKPRLRMTRNDRYKYWVVDGQEFLFDLDSDPGELVNLAGSELVSEMRFELLQGLIGAEDRLPFVR